MTPLLFGTLVAVIVVSGGFLTYAIVAWIFRRLEERRWRRGRGAYLRTPGGALVQVIKPMPRDKRGRK